MMKINQKLKWLLMVLPLAGCATSVPLDVPKTPEVFTSTQTTVKVKSVVQPPVNGVSEVKTTIEKQETEVRTGKIGQPVINLLDLPGDPKALAQPKSVVSKPVNIDPNVQLIAPPVGLPKAAFVAPQVEQKEIYSAPSAAVVKTKVITSTCKTGKKGKTVCKIRSKNETTEVKAKKGNSSKANKSSSKSNKVVSKKTTDSSKKKTVVKAKKKDTKK